MAIPPTTLADLATEVSKLYGDAKTVAQADLSSAQAALSAAKAQQADGAAALAATQKDIAGLRVQLSTTTVPADADALLAEIAELQVTERSQVAALLDAADAVSAAQTASDAASAFVAAVSKKAAEADAAKAQAETDKARRDGWKAAAVAPPLDTLPASAAALLADAAFTDAKDRIDDELPAKLRDALDAGWAVETDRLAKVSASLTGAWSLLSGEWNANGGPDGHVAALRHALDGADEALRRWAETASARFDRAQALLAAAMEGDTLLTEAEADALDANKDAGGDAADLRVTREEARKDLVDETAAYAAAVLAARAKHPSSTDFSGDAAVGTASGKVDDAKDALDTAAGDYDDGQHAAFGTWSGDVPEGVWRKVVGFKEAEEALGELKDADGQDLADADAAAEKDLAGALWNAEKHALAVAFLVPQAAQRAALLDRTLAARPARLLSALRGDA